MKQKGRKPHTLTAPARAQNKKNMKTIFEEMKELKNAIGYFDSFKMENEYLVVLTIPFSETKIRTNAKAFGYKWDAGSKTWRKKTSEIEKQIMCNGELIQIELRTL